MTPSSLFGSQALGVLAVVGFAGCGGAAVSKRPLDPEYLKLQNALASDPCSVKREPDIFVRGTSFDVFSPLHGNLKFLREINPIFLCGLERVEALGDEEYKASADPIYTRRSVGLYTSTDRVIHLKASAGITLTHEVGHHVYNLGPFVATVRDFLAQSWTRDASGKYSRRCTGPDCFISDAAQEQPTEDWARTFEMVLMRPIETGAATLFPSEPDADTRKNPTHPGRSQNSEPVKNRPLRKAVTMDAAEALKLRRTPIRRRCRLAVRRHDPPHFRGGQTLGSKLRVGQETPRVPGGRLRSVSRLPRRPEDPWPHRLRSPRRRLSAGVPDPRRHPGRI
jgi:hypothetical protein